MKPNVKNNILIMSLIMLLVGLTTAQAHAGAFELRIESGRMSIAAQQVPLRDVLYRLPDFGISVRIDPEINPTISATFSDKALEDGLKSILKPYNSVFIWQTEASGNNGMPSQNVRLNEIQIFKPGKKDRMVELDEEPDEAALQIPTEDHTSSQTFETPVIIKADRVFVPVMVRYGGQTIETRLIFDTGASSMVLHEEVAYRLGIFEGNPAIGRGVGGIEINARIAQLESVQVGPYEKRNLRVAIVPYEGEPVEGYHGLLGMNFLRGLTYEIDFDRQVIKWGGENAIPPAQASEENAETSSGQ